MDVNLKECIPLDTVVFHVILSAAKGLADARSFTSFRMTHWMKWDAPNFKFAFDFMKSLPHFFFCHSEEAPQIYSAGRTEESSELRSFAALRMT